MTTIHIYCEGRGHISVNVLKVVPRPGVNSKKRAWQCAAGLLNGALVWRQQDPHSEDAIKTDEIPASCSVCLGEKCYAISKTSQQD